jgi:hypothetical protein
MNKRQGSTAERRRAERNAKGPGVGRYVPMAAAVVVALVSALTLTAYDRPLDRQALTPSVMEFMDGGNIQPVSVPQDGNAPQPHAMLLRYDLGRGEAPVITWHSWSVPAQGRTSRLDSML